MSDLKLSIIITSYTLDRMKDIMKLLDSIKEQTYHNIETIFVAELSKTLFEQVKIYDENEAIPGFIILINNGQPGASSARNLGIEQSKGDIIAFIDDDAVAFTDWAEKMVKTYQDETVIGVTGPAFPLWQDTPVSWFPEEFYWILSCTSSWNDWTELTEVRNIWLQNGSFRRNAFDLAGFINIGLGPTDSTLGFKGREFKEGIVSEEVELSLRVKKATQKRIVYNPDVRVKHKVDSRRIKLGYVVRWSYWMGYSKYRLKQLHTDSSYDMLSQEHNLLKRIITRLLPNIATGFLGHPVYNSRRLLVTVASLASVLAGYLAAFIIPKKQNL